MKLFITDVYVFSSCWYRYFTHILRYIGAKVAKLEISKRKLYEEYSLLSHFVHHRACILDTGKRPLSTTTWSEDTYKHL